MSDELTCEGITHRKGDPACCAVHHGCLRRGCRSRIHHQKVIDGIMIVCEDCPEDRLCWASDCELLDPFFDGELSLDGAQRFCDHLVSCKRCQGVLEGRMHEFIATVAL